MVKISKERAARLEEIFGVYRRIRCGRRIPSRCSIGRDTNVVPREFLRAGEIPGMLAALEAMNERVAAIRDISKRRVWSIGEQISSRTEAEFPDGFQAEVAANSLSSAGDIAPKDSAPTPVQGVEVFVRETCMEGLFGIPTLYEESMDEELPNTVVIQQSNEKAGIGASCAVSVTGDAVESGNNSKTKHDHENASLHSVNTPCISVGPIKVAPGRSRRQQNKARPCDPRINRRSPASCAAAVKRSENGTAEVKRISLNTEEYKKRRENRLGHSEKNLKKSWIPFEATSLSDGLVIHWNFCGQSWLLPSLDVPKKAQVPTSARMPIKWKKGGCCFFPLEPVEGYEKHRAYVLRMYERGLLGGALGDLGTKRYSSELEKTREETNKSTDEFLVSGQLCRPNESRVSPEKTNGNDNSLTAESLWNAGSNYEEIASPFRVNTSVPGMSSEDGLVSPIDVVPHVRSYSPTSAQSAWYPLQNFNCDPYFESAVSDLSTSDPFCGYHDMNQSNAVPPTAGCSYWPTVEVPSDAQWCREIGDGELEPFIMPPPPPPPLPPPPPPEMPDFQPTEIEPAGISGVSAAVQMNISGLDSDYSVETYVANEMDEYLEDDE